jgi:murein DD-endopeptidase MepM/ murein hydrolase activator NlpD
MKAPLARALREPGRKRSRGQRVRSTMKRALLVAGAVLVIAVLWIGWRAGMTARALAEYAAPPDRYLVPVEGVTPRALTSTFGAPRSEGRHHEGIDIFARRGTPVIAATAGRVVRIGTNRLGGNVVWVAGAGAQLYYYAHLDGWNPRLSVGDRVTPGAVLGTVGTTGNAAHTPPHLHFGVYPLATQFRAIDPYPLLHASARSKRPSAS